MANIVDWREEGDWWLKTTGGWDEGLAKTKDWWQRQKMAGYDKGIGGQGRQYC